MRPNCIPDRSPCYPILYRFRWLPACLAFLLALATTQGTSVVPPDFQKLAGDACDLFRVVYNPALMFEFETFKSAFAREVIPAFR